LECQKEFRFENNVHKKETIYGFLLIFRRTAKRRQRGKTMEDIATLGKKNANSSIL